MRDKTKKIIHKYVEFLTTKIKLVFFQRKYSSGGVELKYILRENKKSKALLVVFSSCTRRGIKARYNYMRTLQDIPCNQLYILDDFALDQRGSYYLGDNYTFSEEKATLALINHIKDKTFATNIICCGSSKGGYSAINFGLQLESCSIVAGAPQFFLAKYLKQSGNLECLSHILGEETPERIENLDNKLANLIKNNADSSRYKIYLHYSDKEHTYFEHIEDLLKVFVDNKYNIETDIGDYTNHSDIALHFPAYLREKISKLI